MIIEFKKSYRVPIQERDKWQEMITWCCTNLYHGGYYEPKWSTQYPFIVFEDEKEYAWFMLRWG